MIETIDKDDLNIIAKMVNIMRYTSADLMEKYFDKYNRDNKEDHLGIIWEFNASRARAEIINDYLCELEKELESHNIRYWQ